MKGKKDHLYVGNFQMHKASLDQVVVGLLVLPSITLCRRLWSVTEPSKRLVTFRTFDQSDEEICISVKECINFGEISQEV